LTALRSTFYTGLTSGVTIREVDMRPFIKVLTAAFVLGLAILTSAAGQQASQTTEINLTPEQWGDEIAAWKKQLAEIVKDLYDPSKIWVRLQSGDTVATDDEELVRTLRENKILEMIRYAQDIQLLEIRDFRLEIKSEFRKEVESSVKETYAELVKQDRAIREIKEKQTERLRELIRMLEKKRENALVSRSKQADTPQFKPDEAAVSETEKEAVRAELGPRAKEENWDTRDIDYVLSYLRKTRTPSELRLVKGLIKDFSDCYRKWTLENARIIAAAKAGSWMPGKRIGALSQALDERNVRLGQIKTSFEEVW